MRDKNIVILNKIRDYCFDIANSIDRFGDSLDIFISDKDFQNTVCMSLMQIGELTAHLSDDFKETFKNEVDWKGTKHFRNIVAHRYGTIDHSTVWNIAKIEVSDILGFCTSKINEYTVSEQYSEQTEGEKEETYGSYTVDKGRDDELDLTNQSGRSR